MKKWVSQLGTTFKQIQPNIKQATLNTAWLLVERVVKIFSELVIIFVLARYLGPNQFGLFSYATALIGLGSILAKLGLDDVAVRFLVEDSRQRSRILTTCLTMKIVAGFLTYGALITFAYGSQRHETALLISILGLTLPLQAIESLGFLFKAELNSRPLVISNSISLLIGCIAKISCVMTQQSLQVFAWCILFETVIGCINLSLVYYLTNHRNIVFNVASIRHVKPLINASLPILISGIAVTAYMRADQIMIKEMLGTEALGLYSAASKISESWYFLPTIVTRSLLPVAIRLKKENQTDYQRLFKLLFRYLGLASIAISVGLSLFSGFLITALFGDEYTESRHILIAHSLGGIFVCMGLVLGLWTIVEGKTEKMIINTGVGALTNIILNFFFIQRFGILGAAISTVISRAFAGVFVNLLVRDLRPIFRLQLQAFYK